MHVTTIEGSPILNKLNNMYIGFTTAYLIILSDRLIDTYITIND